MTEAPPPAAAPTRAAPAHAAGARPSLGRLTAVELRKVFDTRAGHWLLALGVLLVAAASAWLALRSAGSLRAFPVSYRTHLHGATTVAAVLLPVLGVLAMTSEWTQRTALGTYTLVPQRGRVLVAKLTAVLLVAVATVVLIAASAAASTLLASQVTGGAAHWDGAGRAVAGALVSTVLAVLMGAALGALLQHTPAALVAYFVAPTLVAGVAVVAVGDEARWVNATGALERISEWDLQGSPTPVVCALTLWIAVPLAAGAVRTLRREVV